LGQRVAKVLHAGFALGLYTTLAETGWLQTQIPTPQRRHCLTHCFVYVAALVLYTVRDISCCHQHVCVSASIVNRSRKTYYTTVDCAYTAVCTRFDHKHVATVGRILFTVLTVLVSIITKIRQSICPSVLVSSTAFLKINNILP